MDIRKTRTVRFEGIEGGHSVDTVRVLHVLQETGVHDSMKRVPMRDIIRHFSRIVHRCSKPHSIIYSRVSSASRERARRFHHISANSKVASQPRRYSRAGPLETIIPFPGEQNKILGHLQRGRWTGTIANQTTLVASQSFHEHPSFWLFDFQNLPVAEELDLHRRINVPASAYP